MTADDALLKEAVEIMTAWMVHEEVLLATEKRFGPVEKVPHKLQLLTDNGSAYIAKSTKRLHGQVGIEDCKTVVCSHSLLFINLAFCKFICSMSHKMNFRIIFFKRQQFLA